MKYRIGIDLGGTSIKVGLIKGKKVIKKVKKFTGPNLTKKEILKLLDSSIKELKKGLKKNEIKGIGVGVPGVLDFKKGRVINLPNLPKFKNVFLKKLLEKKYNLPVVIDNDTNAFAWGEFLYGAGKGKNNVVSLTIGTGLGGAIIINKKIYRGKGSAGELGHMSIIAEGRLCNCGNTGCLEEYVSTRAIDRYSKYFMGDYYHPLTIEKKAKKGDKNAQEVYKEAGKFLGVGLVNINNIFNPDVIIIGGNISNAGYLILKGVTKILKERSLLGSVKVVQSKLKENAGIIGAANFI